MYKIKNSRDLQIAIGAMENRKISQEKNIQIEIAETVENLKPANLVRNLFHSAFSSPQAKESVLSAVIGLGSGFLSRKLLIGPSSSILKKVVGTAIQFAVTGLVSRNAESIKEKGLSWIGKIFPSKKKFKLESEFD